MHKSDIPNDNVSAIGGVLVVALIVIATTVGYPMAFI